MSDNLKQKTISALTWTAVDRFGQQIFQFIIGVILARNLSKGDFGLLGEAMIFASLSYVLVESGFGQALIRKKDANDIDYNSVFYFNIFASFFLFVILFLSAPLIASFFKEPQLVLICRVLFIGVLFNAFYLVPFAKKVKDMDFKSVAKVNIVSVILSGSCGVVLAILNYGVWALVWQQVSFQFVRMIAYQYFVKWKPRLMFSFQVIREFWSFSINVLGTSLLNVVFNNIYVFVFGKFYLKEDVGCYNQANKLSETFNFTFQQIILGSTFSMFSQIGSDNDRFRRIFREVSKKTALFSIPVVLVLIVIAKPLIFVLLSAKWLSLVPYFQLLCLATLFSPFYGLNTTALNARGLSKSTFNIEIVKKVLILLSLVVCFRYGIVMMLVGNALVCFVSYFISVIYLKNEIVHYFKNQVLDLIPGLIVGSIIAVPVYLLSFVIVNYFVLLSIQLILVMLLYIQAIRWFHPELYNQVLGFVVQKITLVRKKEL